MNGFGRCLIKHPLFTPPPHIPFKFNSAYILHTCMEQGEISRVVLLSTLSIDLFTNVICFAQLQIIIHILVKEILVYILKFG